MPRHLTPIQTAIAKLEENWLLDSVARLIFIKNCLLELSIIKIVTPAARTSMNIA
jgi:hypothetical protein